MTYDPDWVPANLADMAEFCRVNSLPQTANALKEVQRICELEIERVTTTKRSVRVFTNLGSGLIANR